MIYENVTIKDICDIKSGKRLPKGTDFSSEITRYPYIRVRDIKSGKINGDDLVYLDEEVQKKIQRYIVNTDDIVITIAGTVGDVGFVTEEFDGFNLTENAVRLTNFDERVNSHYLLYVMNSKKYWNLMQQIAGGSAQPKLGIYKVESIPLELPSIEIQNKIVDILSNYDSLIENNQKQIKLLEEVAQRLYKEWFVDLRFPGYEDVKIVDGVPERWINGTLGDIAFFKRGKTITKAQVQEGDVPVVAGGVGPAYYHNKSNTVAPVITVSGSGNAGFARLYNVNVFASDCSFADSQTTPFLFFVYCFIKDNQQSFYALQKGSVQPHVYAKDINAFKLSIPTEELLESFCKLVFPYFEKIKMLQKQVELSAQARNRLLPKLMNGDIEM